MSIRPASPVLSAMVDEIAAKHDLTVDQLLSGLRSPGIVKARHEFFYRALKETSESAVKIALACGGKDHQTCLYGASKHGVVNNLPMPRGGAHHWRLLKKRQQEAIQ